MSRRGRTLLGDISYDDKVADFSKIIMKTCTVYSSCVTMQERRKKRMKKGSKTVKQREARRQERLLGQLGQLGLVCTQQAPVRADSPECKSQQERLIIELAWRTVALLRRNTLIQQKIIALQKETSEFVSSVMNNQKNGQLRCVEFASVCELAESAAR